jgi:hypothetical protein
MTQVNKNSMFSIFTKIRKNEQMIAVYSDKKIKTNDLSNHMDYVENNVKLLSVQQNFSEAMGAMVTGLDDDKVLDIQDDISEMFDNTNEIMSAVDTISNTSGSQIDSAKMKTSEYSKQSGLDIMFNDEFEKALGSASSETFSKLPEIEYSVNDEDFDELDEILGIQTKNKKPVKH